MSYGGVYVKDLNRLELFDAMDARRTTAATDKIFMEFSCNGHLMGELFELSEAPELKMAVHGTAPISRVTLVRNEADYQVFEPEAASTAFTRDFTDEKPEPGEYRYYFRVEQVDGNMGWTSPVWVKMKRSV